MDIATRTSLQDTHIVVFGGSSGIGLATALAAKANGANVTIVGRTSATLEAAANEIGGVRTAVADIADRKSVEAVFDDMTRVEVVSRAWWEFEDGVIS
jgi:NAD(P)-dependent dehydrogenase (short-subunit alcohol dehydrogenase family)